MFPRECLATIERVTGEVLYFAEFALACLWSLDFGIRTGIGSC